MECCPSIRYITIEEAEHVHKSTLYHSGGGQGGFLNKGLLDSILYHIQNDDYYPTFEEKLTHLFYAVARSHCCVDGNKRLAITLSATFLLMNGRMAVAQTFIRQMEDISYHVAAGSIAKPLLERIMTAVLRGEFENNRNLKQDILTAIAGKG